MEPDSSAPRTYAIAGGLEGKLRLDLLARVYRESTVELLERAGIRPGMRCLDLGCGGGHVSREMARLVGPSGRVVGVDADAAVVDLARADAAAGGVENLEFRVGDAHALAALGPFDLVFARYLLSHVARPESVIAHLVERLAPGGVAAVEDTDTRGAFSDPACPALDEAFALYRAVVRGRGGDADRGAQLPLLLRGAGLQSIGVRIVQPAFLDGEGKSVTLGTIERVRAAALQDGIADAPTIDRIIAELRAFIDRSDTLMALLRTVQAWGRRAA